LFVIHGSKALRAAIERVFGELVPGAKVSDAQAAQRARAHPAPQFPALARRQAKLSFMHAS